MLKLANSGNSNSGHSNSGNSNSGHSNSGHRNSGNSNSGNRNSGNGNSGNRNSGNRNSGDWNSGDWNSGDWNSGIWNSGDWNSGYFNSTTPDIIRVFNKDCERSKWDNAIKPSFVYKIYTNVWIWINDMSDQEKIDNPNAFVCNGYLKTFTYKEAWKNAFNNATKEDIKLLKKLPNFDPIIFEEISGIKID